MPEGINPYAVQRHKQRTSNRHYLLPYTTHKPTGHRTTCTTYSAYT